MSDFPLSYREVIPDLSIPENCKEFVLNTGGTQSTLQDIKVPERANGYCYKDASKHYTRNRFIYWKISNDVLELTEQSLDINLSGNRVRFRFTDTPILDGISIHEFYDSVIILIPTVCSVHRLSFSHPNKIHKQDELLGCHPDLSVPSIFSDISPLSITDSNTYHVVNHPSITNTVLPHVAASYLNTTQAEEAIFVFGYPTGELLLVRQLFLGKYTTQELKQESIVPRFLTGIAEALRGKNNDGHVPVSIVLHSLNLEIFAIILCRDGILRIWSCSKVQYILTYDILTELNQNANQLIQAGQSHILRKSVNSNDSDFILTIFLSFTNETQFYIVRPVIQNGSLKIVRLCTVYSSYQDLMDFSVDNKRLWAVWRGVDGDCYVNTARLDNSSASRWIPVILNPPLDPEYVGSEPGVDPRQAYVSFIFHPGRFSLNVITKALSIYKRSVALSDINLSPAVLKERVCMAIEQEIQTEVHEYEVSDEDYLEIANRCWSKFYSCCVQYQAAGSKPLGLLLLPAVSGAIFLKKSTYSFLRPLDCLEHMMLCSEGTSVKQFQIMNHPQLAQDIDLCSDLIQLMTALVSLEQQLTEEFKNKIEKELCQLRSPDKIMSELVIDLMVGSDEPILSTQFLWTFSQSLSNCTDLYRSMHLLLEMLRLDTYNENKMADGAFSKLLMSVNYLFTSDLGISVITESLHQIATVRFSICRNLLLLQNILLERRKLQWGVLEAIRSVCMPDSVVFMQAYYVVMWLSEQQAHFVNFNDDFVQRLASLKLAPVFGLKTKYKKSMTLLQLFTSSTGGASAHNLFANNCRAVDENLAQWHVSLLQYVYQLGRLVWAVSGEFILGEWLLTSGQHIILQQYVRLLNPWCEWNNCSRNFVLGVALLNNGEKFKAKDLFLISWKGVFVEKFLREKISGAQGDNDSKTLVNYYLKVIQLFELFGARDCAMYVARTAFSAVKADDPHRATLHSVIFIHHLQLEHWDEAYTSLIANPDKERRIDHLRELVTTLLDKRMLDVLMSFPYVDMVEMFTNIVTARARACDSIQNVYYDLLYAFEIKRNNMRLAATAMYEQAYRLGQYNTMEALDKQVKCYLVCLNALSLVNEHHKWIIRPVDQGEEEKTYVYPQPAASDEPPTVKKLHFEIKPMSIEKIQEEYELANARLGLARCNPKTLDNQFSTPNELVTVMSKMGLFKWALKLSEIFKVSNDVVFESLTKICILLTRNDSPKAWNWLVHNDLADLDVVSSSPATVAWDLLKLMIAENEEPKLSSIHKVVTKKIITMGSFIPHWLLASYKRTNPAELLRLLYSHGRILECSTISREYIAAALGQGPEYFGLEHSLLPTAGPLCLPVYLFNDVVYQLKFQAEKHTKYQTEYEAMDKAYKLYLETADRVSREKIQLEWLKVKNIEK